MKKRIVFLFTLILITVSMLAACGGRGDGGTPESCTHEYESKVTKDATCTAEGTLTYTCTLCEDSYTEAIKVTEHKYSSTLSSGETKHFYACECGAKSGEENHISSGAPTATKDEVCTACGYVINEAVGISFKTLKVDGTNASGNVSNSTTTFSFINEIKTAGGAKFTVALDEYGMQPVATKTISLLPGDNTVYVIETVDDEPTAVYTVTIRRQPTYTVSFDNLGYGSVSSQTVEEGSLATEPTAPTRAGYTFNGWDKTIPTVMPAQNVTISAKWKAIFNYLG